MRTIIGFCHRKMRRKTNSRLMGWEWGLVAMVMDARSEGQREIRFNAMIV